MPIDKTNFRPNPLNQTEAIALARELSNQQINIIRNNKEFGGELIADKLLALRNAVWGSEKTGRPLPEEEQKKVFDQTLVGLNPEQKEQILSSYAKMGHLYEIASLSARANTLAKIDPKKEAIPGGSDELIRSHPDLPTSQLVEKLNRPVFEVVMTAHPTNVNSLASMKVQREIDKALERKDQEALTKALTDFQRTPILVERAAANGKKEPVNLTVRDETETALYFLKNIYEDLPKVYKNYDDALAKHSGSKEAYDKTALKLNLRFGSWASAGDKDGNNKVTAETTLEAIALHTQAIVTHYAEDLKKINSPALANWQTDFTAAKAQLDELLPKIAELRESSQKGGNPKSLSDGFDKLSGELAKIRNSLNGENLDNKKRFEKDLEQVAKSNDEALNLLRRFRTFGFNFSKIEYRETAKEYSRVVGEIVEGYNSLSRSEKVTKLTEILNSPGQQQLVSQNKYDSIVNAGAGKPYNDGNAAPIAYQTLKRMALARDFSDVIKDNVLAECGQIKANGTDVTKSDTVAQGLANILEAQFLQRAVEKDKKRPKMGIIPLFEEPETLSHIDDVMKAAYANEAYRKHLESIKAENGDTKNTQQVMIAHSDNARRSGLQAARAYIHIAHHKMRKLNSQNPDIQLQFFEGGSISDAYRNGVRSISKSVDAFGLHDFAKFTFQGGDLLNFFNHPAAINRLLESSISHQAKPLTEENGWSGKVKWSSDNSPDIDKADRKAIEENVNSALKKTLKDYQLLDFTPDSMGVLLAALGYKKVTLDSNASSRAGERSTAFVNPKTGLGGVITNAGKEVGKPEFIPIKIDDVRTIGFSKTWQGAGIVPSWIGSKDLKDHLDFIFSKDDRKTSISESKDGFLKDKSLTAAGIRKIYEYSPTFRDAQARAAFAIAMTDMDSATQIAEKKLKEAGTYKESGEFYLDHVQKTYKSAAHLAYSAMTGKDLNGSNLSNKAIRDKMVDALPQLKEDIINKTNYRAALLHWQVEAPELYESKHMGRIAQAAKDTVEHGRWLGASDPSYANYIEKQRSEHTTKVNGR